jgi:hypothetical protein
VSYAGIAQIVQPPTTSKEAVIEGHWPISIAARNRHRQRYRDVSGHPISGRRYRCVPAWICHAPCPTDVHRSRTAQRRTRHPPSRRVRTARPPSSS